MAIEPEFGSSEVSKIYLDFDFTQMEKVTLNYTFIESLVEIIIVLPIVFGAVLALHSLLCLVIFYKDFSKHIQQRYYATLEIEEVLKYQAKFKRINSAIDGMEEFSEVVNKLNEFIRYDYKDKSLDELIEFRKKLDEFDTALPSFEDLNVAVSFKDQLKKASLAAKREAVIAMLEYTLNDIVMMVKKRISPVGIFELSDKIKTDYATK